jgi:hypothetical protein
MYSALGPLLKTFMDREPRKNLSDPGWAIRDTAQRVALRRFWNGLRQQHQRRLKDAESVKLILMTT